MNKQVVFNRDYAYVSALFTSIEPKVPEIKLKIQRIKENVPTLCEACGGKQRRIFRTRKKGEQLL